MIKYKLIKKLQWEYPDKYLTFLYNKRLKLCQFYQKSMILDSCVPEEKLIKHQPRDNTTPKNILFMLHWYELGGAESYALKNIEMAKGAGNNVYCIATVPSENKDKYKFQKFCDEILDTNDINCDFDDFIIKYIFDKKITHIHIHHSGDTYQALPKIKELYPHMKVIDSTHIVEYMTGGFPELSAAYSDYIDLHNVISSKLKYFIKNRYNDIHNGFISDDKFSLTYLSSLLDESQVKVKSNLRNTFNITFYGRIAPQKQPYFFLHVVNEILKKNKNVLINIYGEGQLDYHLPKIIKQSENRDRIFFHGRCDDKNEVFNNTDILYIPSLNEGLTLTAYEAAMFNVPTISSNVGAQSELLPKNCLISLDERFIEKSVNLINKMIVDKNLRTEVVKETLSKLELLRMNEFCQDHVYDFYS